MCEGSLGFSICMIMISVNRDSFPFSIPIWMLLIALSCLIVLTGPPVKCLIKVVRTDITVLSLILSGILPLSMTLAVRFLYISFIKMRKSLPIPRFLNVFYHENVLEFVKCFFFIYWHVVLFCSLFYWYGVLYWLFWGCLTNTEIPFGHGI